MHVNLRNLACLAVTILCASLGSAQLRAQQRLGAGTLRAFSSESEMLRYFRPPSGQPSGRPRVATGGGAANFVACTAQPVIAIDSAARGSGAARLLIAVVSADSGAQALFGVAVSMSAQGIGTITGPQGTADLVIPADSLVTTRSLTVVARRIGFQPQRFSVSMQRGDRIKARIPMCQNTPMLSQVVASGSASNAITNTQSDGVDEGGIVKRQGNLLVILRRGRLFTVRIDGRKVRPVASVNAYGPDITPSGAWYDELLISGDRVIVIGYSYQRGGTEIGLFQLGRNGSLRYLDTYQLSGNDYYSSDNYAARLIGSELIVYTPVPVWRSRSIGDIGLPMLRRWDRRGRAPRDTARFRRIVSARRIYRAPPSFAATEFPTTLHAVIRCNLRRIPMTCGTTSVMGGPGHVFYVSRSAVHIAAVSSNGRDESATTIFRVPLSGADPTAIRVRGSPINQFSFDERGGNLRMLLQQRGTGDGMWNGERRLGSLAVLSVPVAEFGDGAVSVPRDRYLTVPAPTEGYAIENRFIGDALVYGGGAAWGRPKNVRDSAYVIRFGDKAATAIAIDHAVDRIEAMGTNAVLVGAGARDLTFSAVNLKSTPRLSHIFRLPGAAQGESRSHGFFYRADRGGRESGVLGLPVAGAGRAGFQQLWSGSNAVIFLRNSGTAFEQIGALSASSSRPDDDCRASCVDWYGNARPLFLDDRFVALMGYELVEGRLANDQMKEVSRVSFAPPVKQTRK